MLKEIERELLRLSISEAIIKTMAKKLSESTDTIKKVCEYEIATGSYNKEDSERIFKILKITSESPLLDGRSLAVISKESTNLFKDEDAIKLFLVSFRTLEDCSYYIYKAKIGLPQ